ncbi:PDDEXK-like family protein [Rhizobium binxianense]
MTNHRASLTQSDFENLFVNNQYLTKVETYLNRFNPITTMRMERMEIRHSAILAWLLDPRETHGLQDKFLRTFLCEAMRGQGHMGSPTALEISQADLRDADVRREWQSIDIFIMLPRLNWVFIIENKFQSNQHEGQLAKYAERVTSIFEPYEGALKVRGIFLTLYEEPPEDESFVPIHYSAICEILPNLLEQHSDTIRNDVGMFVRHYVEIIREATGMSSEQDEMEGLARQLYRTHRKVLDFIMEHGATTDFVLAVEAAFGENIASGDDFEIQDRTFMFNDHNNHQASFLPRSWIDNIGAELYWGRLRALVGWIPTDMLGAIA